MVTGIETAGLVLAAFPLLIEGVKSYSKGVGTIRDMRRYEDVLNVFASELETEYVKYESICTRLLEHTVDDKTAIEMMANPKGELWKDRDFKEDLRQRLTPGEKTLDTWLRNVQEMHDIVAEIQETFLIDPKTKKPPARFEKRRAFKVGMKKEHRTEALAAISKRVETIVSLAGGWSTIKEDSVPRSKRNNISRVMRIHKRIQENAKSLFSLLTHKLDHSGCACGSSHEANLRLVARSFLEDPWSSKTALSQDNFHCLFSTKLIQPHFPTPIWREYLVEVEDANAQYDARPDVNQSSVEFQLTVAMDSTPVDVAETQPPLSRLCAPSVNSSCYQSESLDTPMSDQPSATTMRSRFSIKSLKSSIRRAVSPNPLFSRRAAVHKPNSLAPVCSRNGRSLERPRSPARRVLFADLPKDILTQPTSPSLTTHKVIDCFCTTLTTSSTAVATTRQCTGLLVGLDSRRHLFWPPPIPCQPPHTLVSLAELYTHLPAGNGREPHRKSRLILGLKLVSSVMQLGATAWLSEAWSARDILFPVFDVGAGGVACLSADVLAYPLVHRKFWNPELEGGPMDLDEETPRIRPSKLPIVACNESLYSLGIVLMELYQWRAFTVDNGSESADSEYLRALNAASTFDAEAGSKYGDAVRRCVKGLDMSGTSLECEDFRKEVYAKVVLPLEENLSYFCQGSALNSVFSDA